MFFQTTIKRIIKKNITNNFSIYEKYLLKYSSVLDIGCGNGMQAKIIKEMIPGIAIRGLDIKNYLWEENRDIPLTLYEGYVMPFADNAFNAGLFFFVLHHTNNPTKILSEALRICQNQLIIAEEVYSSKLQKWTMIIYDILLNLIIFGEFISIPKFKRKDEWIKIFNGLGIQNPICIEVKRNFYQPPNRIFFILKK